MKSKIVAQWLIVGVILLVASFIVRRPNCPDEVSITLGSLSSMDLGNRASIQRLSKEIKKCPNAKRYRVVWTVVSGGKQVDVRAALYDRNLKLIGYEDDPESGFSYVVAIVNDGPVHAVAQKNGTFSDFAFYDTTRK